MISCQQIISDAHILIDLIDAWGGRHTVKLNLVTTSFEEALKGVSYIMMNIPAIGAKDFFKWIMPYLESGPNNN